AWEHTPASLARQLERAEDIAAECASADERYKDLSAPSRGDETFPPRPGTWCGWCDYRAHCPEGSAAAVPRRPWDGLADPEPAPAIPAPAVPAPAPPAAAPVLPAAADS